MKNVKIVMCVTIAIVFVVGIYFFNGNSEGEEVNYNELDVVNNVNEETVVKKSIIVHISGEINSPGVIILAEGDRIINAIEYAGGITQDADLSNVNLAYELIDGQKIYIPSKYEEEAKSIIQENAENVVVGEYKKDDKININKADEQELQKLNGVGASTAKKIIQYRNENGAFKDIEELKNVSGIGESKFNMMKDSVCIK